MVSSKFSERNYCWIMCGTHQMWFCSYCSSYFAKINIAQTPDELANKRFKFARPVMWLERTEHLVDSCYFCVTQRRTAGMSFKHRFKIKYAEVESVYPAVMVSEVNPLEVVDANVTQEYATGEPMEYLDSTFETDAVDSLHQTPSTSGASRVEAPLVVGLSFETASATTQSVSQFELTPSEIGDEKQMYRVTQNDFNDLVRVLGISLRGAEILGSRLKGWNLTAPDYN